MGQACTQALWSTPSVRWLTAKRSGDLDPSRSPAAMSREITLNPGLQKHGRDLQQWVAARRSATCHTLRYWVRDDGDGFGRRDRDGRRDGDGRRDSKRLLWRNHHLEHLAPNHT